MYLHVCFRCAIPAGLLAHHPSPSGLFRCSGHADFGRLCRSGIGSFPDSFRYRLCQYEFPTSPQYLFPLRFPAKMPRRAADRFAAAGKTDDKRSRTTDAIRPELIICSLFREIRQRSISCRASLLKIASVSARCWTAVPKRRSWP